MKKVDLKKLASLVRYFIVTSTTAAGSGHPSSSLSATDLMTVLMFGGFFKADLKNPSNPNNDRLIFSKGHAAPLLYSLYTVADAVSVNELMTLRKFGSKIEGHPTMDFAYTEAATGSLGQGLSIGLGMALNAKLDKLAYKTFVLMGDSETAEGSVWEALELGSHYKLDNLVGIVDVNRLGQRGETLYGHDVEGYAKRIASFGWKTFVVDGHNLAKITSVFKQALKVKGKPVMIIAKTLKGKGVKFIENKDGWHGKPIPKEELEAALKSVGKVDINLRAEVAKPIEGKRGKGKGASASVVSSEPKYELGEMIATRKAYGNALLRLAKGNPNLVALDAETSNSTYAEFIKKVAPERFFEMYIAEQNMVGTALGFSRRGKVPFVSTFAAFLTRAADQIRMSQYSNPNIKFVGSHAGVSIGEDGASQMALEDLSLFRSQLGSVVLYPSEAMQTEKLVEAALKHTGNVYIRTTRKETPVLYKVDEEFPIGGSKTLRSSKDDIVTLVGAGVTLFEALKAHEALAKEGIAVRVIDLYSIKPLDTETLKKAAAETKAIITVEDHYAEGGLGEAVLSALTTIDSLLGRGRGGLASVHMLSVRKMPHSGKPDELLAYEEINTANIVKKVKEIVK